MIVGFYASKQPFFFKKKNRDSPLKKIECRKVFYKYMNKIIVYLAHSCPL